MEDGSEGFCPVSTELGHIMVILRVGVPHLLREAQIEDQYIFHQRLLSLDQDVRDAASAVCKGRSR